MPRGPFYTRGRIRLNKRDYDMALKDFASAARLEPQQPQPVQFRGLTRFLQGQVKRAASDFDLAQSLLSGEKNECDRERTAGLLSLLTSRIADARKHYRKALSKAAIPLQIFGEILILSDMARLFPKRKEVAEIKQWFETQGQKRLSRIRSRTSGRR